ncbi:MAG: acyl-CoA thioesterase [Acidobacteriota bacterium]
MTMQPAAADPFPFASPIEVRFSDIDAMNHVNNAVTVSYLEIARVRVWRERLGAVEHARDFPFILARVSIDYRSPIHFGDEVIVRLRVSRIGATSFTLAYRIEASGRLAAEAETVQVMFDYATGRSVAIEPELRARLESLTTGTGSRERAPE